MEDDLWIYSPQCNWFITNYPNPEVIQCKLSEGHVGIHEWESDNVSHGSA
jgi:hypothetical protein